MSICARAWLEGKVGSKQFIHRWWAQWKYTVTQVTTICLFRKSMIISIVGLLSIGVERIFGCCALFLLLFSRYFLEYCRICSKMLFSCTLYKDALSHPPHVPTKFEWRRRFWSIDGCLPLSQPSRVPKCLNWLTFMLVNHFFKHKCVAYKCVRLCAQRTS